jgi:predicted RNA-binding protein
MGSEEKEFMADVVRLEVSGGMIKMSDLLGEVKEVEGTIESIDFLGHKLFIIPK